MVALVLRCVDKEGLATCWASLSRHGTSTYACEWRLAMMIAEDLELTCSSLTFQQNCHHSNSNGNPHITLTSCTSYIIRKSKDESCECSSAIMCAGLQIPCDLLGPVCGHPHILDGGAICHVIPCLQVGFRERLLHLRHSACTASAVIIGPKAAWRTLSCHGSTCMSVRLIASILASDVFLLQTPVTADYLAPDNVRSYCFCHGGQIHQPFEALITLIQAVAASWRCKEC